MYDVPKEYRAAIRSPTRKDRMAGKLTLDVYKRQDFKGVYDRTARRVLAFESDGRANGVKMVDEIEAELGDPRLDELIGAANHAKLAEDIELLDGAAEEFDLNAVQHGELSPVFFLSLIHI